jgi:uncharacterized repeat protein (TIGR01451 family)/LPXTG-motif cell wall-anchored protein
VTLLRDSDGDGVFDVVVATTTTSGDGGYNFGQLPPGTYRVIVTPPTGQSPTTPASVVVVLEPGQDVTDADVGMATPPAIPFDLELIKDLQGTLVNGEVGTWLLHIQNNGIVASPNPLVVTDVLPTGLTYVGFTGTGWSCDAVGQTITCTLPQSLGVGMSSDLTLRTRVDATAGVTIVNAATVSANGVEITLLNNSDPASGVVLAQPTTTTTSTTTTTAIPTTSTPAPPTVVTGSLPATGSPTTQMVALALLLVSGGLLILVMRRRLDADA